MANFDVGDVILGKYKVTRVLGRGGMGVVVAARNLRLDELVAVKFLHTAGRESEASAERFVREARTATRLKSRHVVRVFDVDRDEGGTPFIVMEYLTGQDLAAEIRQDGPLPVEKAVDLLLQACEAIAEAHNLGFVHRDLKPANLFVTTGEDGMPCIKVLDFGIAKSLSAAEASVTASQAVVGSPLYMSPEQLAASKNVDARSDVWSLGVILYEMLTGATPFPGESIATVGAAVFGGLYTRLSVARPDVPAELDEAVADALTRDLEKRLPSVRELAARIAPFGSNAARVSLERIERIAARAAPASTEAADATVAEGPPSAVQAARAVQAQSGRVTGQAASQSIAESPRRSSRSRRTLAVAAIGIAAVAAAAGIFVRMRAKTSGGATPVCSVPDADKGNLCHECKYKTCCAQYLACHESTACEEYLSCTRACEDNSRTCRDACVRAHPEGHAIAAPLLACTTIGCLGPCSPRSPDTTCTGCQLANCPTEAASCLGDPACDALAACDTACGPRNDACRQKCRSEQSSATQKKFNEFLSCGMTYCASTCGPAVH